ncbi:hypothetical protein BGZ81_011509 [Podila clonocystis]|nr:hypothetical protein BGZ81_011509 [Podila clonocystis]
MGSIAYDDPQTVIPLIKSFKHTLQYRDGHTPFELLGLLLGSLPELLRLKFVAEGGLSKEESIDIFRGTFPQEEGVKSEDLSAGAARSLGNGTAGWACQRLERLSLCGLWGTMAKDKLAKGYDAVTLKAASDKHQWVACDATNFGNKFRGIISERIQTLPALNELKLSSVYFEYTEIPL